MEAKTTERRCMFCKKLLLDEKLSICHRCWLEGRNKAGQFIGAAAGIATTAVSFFTIVNNSDQSSNEDVRR